MFTEAIRRGMLLRLAAIIFIFGIADNALLAAEISADDISFEGEYGSEGATLKKVATNHFQVILKKVPEKPNWTNMVQFTIKKNATGNNLRIDIEDRGFPINENGLRGFVSWSYDQETWHSVKRTLIKRDGKSYASLSFPKFEQEKVFVGGEVPLSYEKCVEHLNKFKVHADAELHVIGKSLRGRNIYRLTITDSKSPIPLTNRWAHHFVNQHCYEYNAQWRMIGMIQYLLSDQGKQCRQNHVWHFVVQMNVDGPSAGLGRVNTQGRDMNRSYSSTGSDHQVQAYEAFLVQQDLELLMVSETPVTTTWSMHTWDTERLDPMVRPGKDMGKTVGPWTELRDILKQLDTRGQFNTLNNVTSIKLTPTTWCSGSFIQFGISSFCCEGGGLIYNQDETLHTGEVLVKALHEFYGSSKP